MVRGLAGSWAEDQRVRRVTRLMIRSRPSSPGGPKKKFMPPGAARIPPELPRPAASSIGPAGPLPKLIELNDLCGDLHMHTTATDGKATLEEMVAAAPPAD